MKDLVIYRSNDTDLIRKIKYYKNLGVTSICLDILDKVDEDRVDLIRKTARVLNYDGLSLIIEIDIIKVIEVLLKEANFKLSQVKIRKSLYQFLNYLIKQGVRGFYFTSTIKVYKNLETDNDFISFIRELNKNVLRDQSIISIGQIRGDDTKKDELFLSLFAKNFTYVDIAKNATDDFIKLKTDILSFESKYNNIKKILTTSNSFKNFINSKNYPYHSLTLLSGASFLLNGAPMLEGFEEMGLYDLDAKLNDYNMIKNSSLVHDFYKELLDIRDRYLLASEGDFRLLFTKDPDVFSFIKQADSRKMIVFANFSQREVLLDIRFHFIDLYDFKFLLGNFGKRRIVKNLLLRPYEFVAFIK